MDEQQSQLSRQEACIRQQRGWKYRTGRMYAVTSFRLVILLMICSLCSCTSVSLNGPPTQLTGTSRAASPTTAVSISTPTPVVETGTRRYEYVFPDGGIYVYDMDHGHALVKHVSLPQVVGVRGSVASPSTGMLYISYGGDGDGQNGSPTILKYDLVKDTVVWTKTYPVGIDSMAISPDGSKMYMPSGELSGGGVWYVIDTTYGNIIAQIQGGTGPHNTIVSINGSHVYMGGRNYNYLEVADTSTNSMLRQIGPLRSGVRPFTINGKESIAYTTATGFLGFQVSDITTGRVIYTVDLTKLGFQYPSDFGPSCPSHGISMSPDEKELYVMDAPNDYVHVFDISGVPASAPRKVADIKISSMSGLESPCLYDCARDGWISHSRDGRFVYVGDAGDIIDTTTRTVVMHLPTLANTRKFIEIDFSASGGPIFSPTSRSGVGYVTG